MHIYVTLLYHGKPIEQELYKSSRHGLGGKVIEVEIGRLIDIRCLDAVRRIIGEPPNPPDLDNPPPAG